MSASFFAYYFYQAGGNLHRTEILISQKLAQLPFYWPPGPGRAELNAKMPDLHSVSDNMRDQFCAWFIHQDTALKSGITRADVLSLLGEKLVLLDSEKEGTSFSHIGDSEFRERVSKLVSAFIEKGAGRLPEYKRKSGVSLQNSLLLLDELVREHKILDPEVSQRIEKILDEELGVMISQLPEQQAHPLPLAPMAEVEIDDIDMFDMELGQTRREIEMLEKSSRSLTDAEKDRLKSLQNQRKQLERDIREIRTKK